MMPGPTNIDNDALLVAYLDGALKPEARQDLEHRLATDASLRARLGVLAEGGRQIRSSFDSLLESAPRARLDAIFAAALAKAPRRRSLRYREMLLAAAAALLLLICGGVAGYFIAKAPGELFEEADAFEEQWIDAVAGQLSLYNATSVAAIKVDSAEQQAQLTKLGEILKLDLSAPKVELEGLALKRAELLRSRDRRAGRLPPGARGGRASLRKREAWSRRILHHSEAWRRGRGRGRKPGRPELGVLGSFRPSLSPNWGRAAGAN